MSSRVSFADLLKAGAEKEKQRLNLKLAPPAPAPQSVAPERDFNKRANSLERDALPKGSFPGASKAIYDALYLRTLGAVTPTRTIQATRKELIKWSGVKNIKTINAHLKKLKDLNLVKATNFTGEPNGAHYEVFLPENIEDFTDPDQTQTRPRPDPDQTQTQTRPRPRPKIGLGTTSYLVENKDTYEIAKTKKKKTKKKSEPETGAEPAGGFLKNILFDVFFKIVRSRAAENQEPIKVSLSDAKGQTQDWQKLGELLAMELEIAAARTNSISNVPAFLTEHLRRRLSRKPESRPANKISGAKSNGKTLQLGETGETDDFSKTDVEIYQAEPLTEHARKTVLKTMREYVEKGQRDFVLSLEDIYTTDDWKWLSENLPDEAAGK